VQRDASGDRLRVLELLRQNGWNATSFQILEPGFQYLFIEDYAVVGYVDTGSAWVAAGAPIAPLDRVREVSEAFVAAARKAGRRASCFGTESRFEELTGWPALRIGDQPVWDPAQWLDVVASHKSLREQLRRARAKGVVVRAVDATELALGAPLRTQVDLLIERWLASRPIAPMGFLVQIDPFTFVEERHYFVAEREGKVVAFLGIIPIFARGGWFFEDFLRDPDAPNGTIEMLVDAGMRAAITTKIPFVTLGLVPLAGDVNQGLRAARRLGRSLYDFDGLRAFKAKFAPRAWDPVFLSRPPGSNAFVALFDTLRAFARGGLLRFGLETFLRGPAVIVRALAALLVLWTVLLALPSTGRFFPNDAWQYGWVAFDIVLGAALFQLARKWTLPLANVVATAVTLDAIVTLGQALLFDLPHRRNALDVAFLIVAVAAPSAAALMLWNARAARTSGR
jgi:phosphatidylglycerol lysyltransferase